MATIKITGVLGDFTIDNLRARKVAEDKRNISVTQQKEMWIDLEVWQGYLSKISSITFEREGKYKNMEDYNRPLTPQELQDRAASMARVRDALEKKGVIRPRIGNINNGTCVTCKKEMVAGLKFYCSGKCIEIAKSKGIYGNEETSL